MKRQLQDPIYRNNTAYRPPTAAKKRRPFKKFLTLIVAIVIIAGAIYGVSYAMKGKTSPSTAGQNVSASNSNNSSGSAPSAKPAVNKCSGNTIANLVLVSISQQHLWACAGSSQVYDSAVVTGMEMYPADLTPTGTYHVYAKQTNQVLKGCDSTGCWSDPVSYWMPFLDNQYGVYGFHDATWRAPSDFGNININNPNTAAEHGSHGCVEMPLATAKWLYNWAPVGTTVTIVS